MRQLILLGLILACPGTAFAQSDNDGFARVGALDIGERIFVWTDDGTVVTGRVETVTSTSLAIRRGSDRFQFPAQAVTRVERPRDTVWNGALIGLGIGFVPGAFIMLTCDPGILCDHSGKSALALGGFTGGIGFGIGALTDALVRRERVVFDRRAHIRRVTVAPMAAGGRRAIAVRVSF